MRFSPSGPLRTVWKTPCHAVALPATIPTAATVAA